MACRWLVVAGLAVVFHVQPCSAQVRLSGLERLYYDRIAGPGEKLPASDNHVALLLPLTLEKPGLVSTRPHEIVLDDDLDKPDPTVKDFELPWQSAVGRHWIREVLVHSYYSRISGLYWALYNGGRRSDVWFFKADPAGKDGKVLSNYQLDSVSMPARDVAVFRVRGDMFRTGGAWWIVGKEFIFGVSDSSITLKRVVNVFGFFRGYDTGDTAGSLNVSTEREINSRYEIRDMEAVSDETALACGFQYPDGEWEFSWGRLEKAAQCITTKRGARHSSRDLDAPSFVERAKSP